MMHAKKEKKLLCELTSDILRMLSILVKAQ